jgi:large subunit ribosomal protein L19
MDIVHEIEKRYMRQNLPPFQVGDTVEVRVRIKEGDKERLQPFIGTVIRRQGGSIRESFTVRRIVQGEGVERTFPLHAHTVVTVTVKKRGRVRRSKLYYLRDRSGKATRIRELIEDSETRKVRLADEKAAAEDALVLRAPGLEPEEAADDAAAAQDEAAVAETAGATSEEPAGA